MATPEPDDTEVLGRIFGPTMGRILEKHLKVPVFFLTPHPKLWALRYYAEVRSAREPIDLNELIRKHHDPVLGWGAEALDKLVESLDTDPETLRVSAAQRLRSTVLPLGWTDAAEAEKLNERSHWALKRGGDSTLRFMQHALDHAHGDNFDPLKPPSDQRKLGSYGKSKKLIKITDYMKEEGLIDKESFPSYLAESLYSQSIAVAKKHIPSKLDHYFLPLAGLGQWRAAACWVAYEEELSEEIFDIDTGMQSSIQALFSQALIDAFTSQLDLALVGQTSFANRRDALHNAFSLLWWSQEIAFFRDGVCVARRLRDEYGDLSTADPNSTSLQPAARNSFLSVCAESSCSTVQLDLTYLAEEKNLAREVFGSDRIMFAVRLIEPAEREMVESVYGERLREQIGLALRLYAFQQKAIRAQTVEAIGHSMKNTVHVTGWQEAHRQLQTLAEPRAPEVEAGIRSLSLYALVVGLGGLLRLVGLCEREEFAKIGSWTTPSALDSWRRSPRAAFERYVLHIENYVATICHGLGWDAGFALALEDGERSEARTVPTNVPPRGSIRAWIDEHGNLPPLSATEGPDSHTALLSALTEPVCNAVRSLLKMKNGPAPRTGRLFVRIAANFPHGVNVAIGNETDRPPLGMPPGLSQHRALLERTYLATVGELPAPPRGAGELARYWIEIQLHPLRLAEKILPKPSQGDLR